MQEPLGEGKGEVVKVWGTFRGNEWENKGEVVEVSTEKGVWSFDVEARGPKEYLVERPGCEFFRSGSCGLRVVGLGLSDIGELDMRWFLVDLLANTFVLSLASLHPQEPNDSCCWPQFGHGIWLAISNGQQYVPTHRSYIKSLANNDSSGP